VAELVGEGRAGRLPAELRAGPAGAGALVEEQDFGEVVAQAGAGLVLGARARSWGAGRRGGRGGQLGDGLVRVVADDVVAAGGVVFQGAPEGVRQVGGVHRRPVLLAGAQ